MDLFITTLTASGLAIVMFVLALLVSMRRLTQGSIVFGDGDDDTLRRRIRAHGNFVEYVPLALIVLGLAESQGGPGWLLLVSALCLVLGRVVHAAVSLVAPGAAVPRAGAMMMTHTSYVLPAIWLLWALA